MPLSATLSRRTHIPISLNVLKPWAKFWCHVGESSWLVKTPLSSRQIKGRLSPHLKQDDHLLILFCAQGAWQGFNDISALGLKAVFQAH